MVYFLYTLHVSQTMIISTNTASCISELFLSDRGTVQLLFGVRELLYKLLCSVRTKTHCDIFIVGRGPTSASTGGRVSRVCKSCSTRPPVDAEVGPRPTNIFTLSRKEFEQQVMYTHHHRMLAMVGVLVDQVNNTIHNGMWIAFLPSLFSEFLTKPHPIDQLRVSTIDIREVKIHVTVNAKR